MELYIEKACDISYLAELILGRRFWRTRIFGNAITYGALY